MPKHSDKPLAEIVTNPDAIGDDPESVDDDTIANAEPVETGYENALRFVDPEVIDFYPDIAARREEAQIPPHFPASKLVDQKILIASKKLQKAALPETGELRDGYFCSGLFVETKQPFTTWLGQVALMRDLSAVTVPFKCTIVKHGRTYRFE